MAVYSIHIFCLLCTMTLGDLGNLLIQTLPRYQSIIKSVVRGHASFMDHHFLVFGKNYRLVYTSKNTWRGSSTNRLNVA